MTPSSSIIPTSLQPTPADAPQAPFDFLQVSKLAWQRSWRWILGITVAGIAGVTWYTMAQPNTYASEGKLFLRVGSREGLSSEALVADRGEAGRTQMTMLDELHLLNDDRILEAVARKIGPAKLITPVDPSLQDGPDTPLSTVLVHKLQSLAMGSADPSAHQCPSGEGVDCAPCLRNAVDFLHDTVTALPEYGSSVIVVRGVSYTPQLAQTLVKELLDAYVERHSEKFSAKPLLQKNEPKLIEARARRDRAAQAFYDHVTICGIVDIEGQRAATIAAGQSVDETYASAVATQRSLQAQREALEKRIAEVGKDLTIGAERVRNPVYGRLVEEVETLKIQQAGNDALVASLHDAIERRLETVKKLSNCERIHAELGSARDLELTRCNELERRFAVLQDLTSLDDKADSNLTTLQDAALMLRKVGPMRPKVIAVGAILALALGMWLAILRELFDRRVTHAPMVERQVGTRLLGAIPEYRLRDTNVA